MKKKKSSYTVSVPSEHEDPNNAIKMKPRAAAVERAGHEIKENPPSIVKKTSKKFGRKRARKQAIAIMMEKARKEV